MAMQYNVWLLRICHHIVLKIPLYMLFQILLWNRWIGWTYWTLQPGLVLYGCLPSGTTQRPHQWGKMRSGSLLSRRKCHGDRLRPWEVLLSCRPHRTRGKLLGWLHLLHGIADPNSYRWHTGRRMPAREILPRGSHSRGGLPSGDIHEHNWVSPRGGLSDLYPGVLLPGLRECGTNRPLWRWLLLPPGYEYDLSTGLPLSIW